MIRSPVAQCPIATPAQRLVESNNSRCGVRLALRQLILGLQQRTLGIEHGEKICGAVLIAKRSAIADYGSSPLLKMTKQILCFNKGLLTFADPIQFQLTCL